MTWHKELCFLDGLVFWEQNTFYFSRMTEKCTEPWTEEVLPRCSTALASWKSKVILLSSSTNVFWTAEQVIISFCMWLPCNETPNRPVNSPAFFMRLFHRKREKNHLFSFPSSKSEVTTHHSKYFKRPCRNRT